MIVLLGPSSADSPVKLIAQEHRGRALLSRWVVSGKLYPFLTSCVSPNKNIILTSLTEVCP